LKLEAREFYYKVFKGFIQRLGSRVVKRTDEDRWMDEDEDEDNGR
jgi:hypothetical protein